MNDLKDSIVRIQTLHPFPAGVREDGFANIREADIAAKQSSASGGQLPRSHLPPWSLLVGVPKARESYQRGPSDLQSSVVLTHYVSKTARSAYPFIFLASGTR